MIHDTNKRIKSVARERKRDVDTRKPGHHAWRYNELTNDRLNDLVLGLEHYISLLSYWNVVFIFLIITALVCRVVWFAALFFEESNSLEQLCST